MERRTYLRALGGTGVAGLAGCLDDVPGIGGDDRTVLEGNARGDPSHPVNGEEFPSFSLPDPLAGETVSLEEYTGDRPFLMTFFYTSCPDGACPALLLRLRRVQEDAIERGYADDVGLLATTFDPARDTAEALEEYANQQGVDLEVGNWHFLRPEDNEAAKTFVEDDVGMPVERVEDHSALGHDEGGDNGTDESEGQNETHGNETEANGSHGENRTNGNETHGNESETGGHGDGYAFTHYNLIVLVNEDGVVERAYPRAIDPQGGVSPEELVEDTKTVVDG